MLLVLISLKGAGGGGTLGKEWTSDVWISKW